MPQSQAVPASAGGQIFKDFAAMRDITNFKKSLNISKWIEVLFRQLNYILEGSIINEHSVALKNLKLLDRKHSLLQEEHFCIIDGSQCSQIPAVLC